MWLNRKSSSSGGESGKLARADALNAKPLHLIAPEVELRGDGSARLKVPLVAKGLSTWLFKLPAGASKTFELDTIGLFVWRQCDGKSSVLQIIRSVAAEYRLSEREAEVATTQFLLTLQKKRLIGMAMEKGE